MTNLETNALRIIEFLYPDIDINGIEKYKEFFSSYNGLMPIVFECKMSGDFDIEMVEEFVRFVSNRCYDTDNDISKDYNTEPEFIEAIQLACIKYLEIKNEK